MNTPHAFNLLADVQREQGTMFCVGLDLHPFGDFQANLDVYKKAALSGFNANDWSEIFNLYYSRILENEEMIQRNTFNLAELLASIELFVSRRTRFLVEDLKIRTFKPQSAFYEQFGWLGFLMLKRIVKHLRKLEEDNGKIFIMIDCKRGDIFSTQEAYIRAFLGDLNDGWGIDYTPFDFDIMNVTPWMGSDVLVLGNKEKPGLGTKVMQRGKGMIVVNQTTNESGPRYQKLVISGEEPLTVQMKNVQDMHALSIEHDLEYQGLSALGLVVGSTYVCDGSIRKAFPGTTLLVPGFGAQGGAFHKVIQELIPKGNPYAGQGAIWSSSRAHMFAFLPKYGGDGNPENWKKNLAKSVARFRDEEKAAYKEAGIEFPFAA